MQHGAKEIVGVFEVVVSNEEEEGLEGVEVALLGAVGSLGGVGEGVVGTEPEFITDVEDLVEVAMRGEVAECGERVHWWSRRQQLREGA